MDVSSPVNNTSAESQNFAPSPSPLPEKKSLSRIFLPLLIIVICSLAAGTGGYLLGSQKGLESVVLASPSPELSSPSPKPSTELVAVDLPWEQYLAQECVEKDRTIGFVLPYDQSPIVFDQTVLGSPLRDFPEVHCRYGSVDAQQKPQGFGLVAMLEKQTLYVQGPESELEGAGGAPMSGVWGSKIGQEGPVAFYLYINTPHGGALEADSLSVQLRAVKTLQTAYGESLLVAATVEGFAASDPFWQDTLRPSLQNGVLPFESLKDLQQTLAEKPSSAFQLKLQPQLETLRTMMGGVYPR